MDSNVTVNPAPRGIAVLAAIGPAFVWCAEYIGSGEVILATYGHKDFVDRADFDASLSEETKLTALEGVARVLPALEDATIVEHRGDLLAMAPTPPYQKPVMGRFPEWRNAYVAARFGGDGVCMSPATGELMAELIDTAQVPLRARHLFECLAPSDAR